MDKNEQNTKVQVETKAASQSKTAKMRIATLEASIADLKKTGDDLKAKILELEDALDTKQGELDDSLSRERVLGREIENLKAQAKDQRTLISSIEEQHKEMIASKNGQIDQLQVLCHFFTGQCWFPWWVCLKDETRIRDRLSSNCSPLSYRNHCKLR